MDGPGRVTGGPGTGKTVVALHRAAGFAREATNDRAVLLTSFVKTIPDVLQSLFERLAPECGTRVDARGIHSLASHVLRSRGIEVNPSSGGGPRPDRPSDREGVPGWRPDSGVAGSMPATCGTRSGE